MTTHRAGKILAIYDDAYADLYEDIYLHPWPYKHNLNASNLRRIVNGLSPECRRWLDLACGQAWHFSRVDSGIAKVGIDLSYSQLRLAKRRNPDASFVQADMSKIRLPSASCGLVTIFWAAYCYLNDQDEIVRLLERAISWTRTGGAIYVEVLLPEDLASFNRSDYSEATGFRVDPRTPDYSEWSYEDAGGRHEMVSPPLETFTELFGRHFRQLEVEHDAGFMVQVIAQGKAK